MFNSYDSKYEVIEQTAEQVKKQVKMAGKNLPKFNEKFDTKKEDYTRTTLYVVDSGTLPDGDTAQQIGVGNTSDNFKAVKTLNQSIRRYNQLFSGMMTITIAGDFSLHAGDVIFVDIFSVQAEKDDTVNRESGGLYIIADLCHYVSSEGTYTKLNLARDSFGRKGNHSRRYLMKIIEDHLKKDKEILADPKTSEPMRHHIEDELHDLEEYVEHHKDEIESGDHHDPNVLEVFCDIHPDEPECLVYDD